MSHTAVKPVWVLVLIALALPALGAADTLPPDIGRIKQRNALIVAQFGGADGRGARAPFFMPDKNGRIYGFDVAMAEDIAGELGVDRVVFNRSAKTFSEVVQLLAEKKADVAISKLSVTTERALQIRYTRPYIVLRQALLVNRVQAARSRTQDVTALIRDAKLAGFKVGFEAATSYEEFTQQRFPDAVPVPHASWDDAFAAVKAGTTLAMFRDELEIKKLVRMYPDLSLTVQTVVFNDLTDPIAMAVPWDSTHLLAWLNIYLAGKNHQLTPEKLFESYEEIFDRQDENNPS